ncbi:MAG: YciI family protein [Polyangiaceae bacterium]
MRFMVMHKVTDDMEKGLPPPPGIIEGVGKLVRDGLKDGVFVGGAGLKPTAQRLRIVYKDGKRTITEGPFTDARELIAGFAQMKVRSREEAIGWCDRFAAVAGDTDLFLGPVVEAWDLGVAPKPVNAPLRFLAVHQADARSESETPPEPAVETKMRALVEEMTQAGVLEATGALASTKKGARLRFQGGKRTVIDGPFTESKELIAGYSMLELPSKAAAIDWAIRFVEVVAVTEIDVRQMQDE